MSHKIRIIPTLLYRDTQLVKGKGFDSWRPVGSPMQAVKVYNMREVDELIFLDIRATAEKRSTDFQLIDDLADECFMPLTVGGGIRTVEDVRTLLQVGADKIALNSALYEIPDLVNQIASAFGSQCVVASIDARKTSSGYECFSHSGKTATGKDPVSVAKDAEARGAGEILITSIERDGTMEGYDVELTRLVSEAVNIPVIAAGGAGNYQHMVDVLSGSKASALAAASIYHFTQQTPLEAKQYLREHGFPVRL
ncbi:imidazole glycerol phosphate synthase subunit HisF [Candidatus Peribacteria bacterium]|nr:imidazole glycerol phosphate synthase subunit HisF [Candidatus Peribacteria bacterium]